MDTEISRTVFYLGGNKIERKQILAYWVRHTENKRHYFKWDWSMIWVLVKYRVIWGMDISFTVTKSIDREEYLVEFFAE